MGTTRTDDHHHSHDGPLPPHLDPTVADAELSPAELDRRSLLPRAGPAGAGAAATAALAGAGAGTAAAPAERSRNGRYLGPAGDHHIHPQYGPDAQYRVIDQVSRAPGSGWTGSSSPTTAARPTPGSGWTRSTRTPCCAAHR